MFWLDIVVIEPLDNQWCSFQIGCVQSVVTFDILFVVIMAILVLELIQLGNIGCIVILDLVPIFLIKNTAWGIDWQPREVIGSSCIKRRSLAVKMVIPASDTSSRNNGLETFDSSRGYTEGRCPSPRQACHGHISTGPVSLDFAVAGFVRIGLTLAIQPLNDILVGRNF